MEAASSSLPAALRPPACPRVVQGLEVSCWELEALRDASGALLVASSVPTVPRTLSHFTVCPSSSLRPLPGAHAQPSASLLRDAPEFGPCGCENDIRSPFPAEMAFQPLGLCSVFSSHVWFLLFIFAPLFAQCLHGRSGFPCPEENSCSESFFRTRA